MNLSKEIIAYIEKYKEDFEKRYNITIYYWLVRKSTLRGLGRSTSDLDVAFLFKNNSDEKRTIIFERAERRNEFQCWSVDVLLDVIVENRKRAQESKEFEIYNKDSIYNHYILDYYNGFYCSFGNELRKDYDGFLANCESALMNLYEPLVASKMYYNEYMTMMEKINIGYMMSLNQYLNGIWAGLASIHFLQDGLPGDVNINMLAKKYLDKDDAELVLKLVKYFRGTIQKQSNYCNIMELNSILEHIGEMIKEVNYCYKITLIDVDKEAEVVRKYLQI